MLIQDSEYAPIDPSDSATDSVSSPFVECASEETELRDTAPEEAALRSSIDKAASDAADIAR